MDAASDGPIRLPLESGPLRPVQWLWAERLPAGFGFTLGALMIITALYGEHSALYGLLGIAAWQKYWIEAGKRDPQYGAVMWRAWWENPLPEQLEAWPDIGAAPVKRGASVPVRGQGGAHVTGGGSSQQRGQEAVTQQAAQPLSPRPVAAGNTYVAVNNGLPQATGGIGVGDVALVYGAYKYGESVGHGTYTEELTRRFPVSPQVEYYRSVVPSHDDGDDDD